MYLNDTMIVLGSALVAHPTTINGYHWLTFVYKSNACILAPHHSTPCPFTPCRLHYWYEDDDDNAVVCFMFGPRHSQASAAQISYGINIGWCCAKCICCATQFLLSILKWIIISTSNMCSSHKYSIWVFQTNECTLQTLNTTARCALKHGANCAECINWKEEKKRKKKN